MPAPSEAPIPKKCSDWHEWERCPEHTPFHYWRWNPQEESRSDQRLGERIYIMACLLWTALHDRRLGRTLATQYPNWSAVSSYYSMVHATRLLWFLIYGSYPKLHKKMADSLKNAGFAKPDWSHGNFPRGSICLGSSAFQGFIDTELGLPKRSKQLTHLGSLLSSALELRNDSNYESLVLAHQYQHFVPSRSNMKDAFDQIPGDMCCASQLVLEYVGDVLAASFREDINWVGRNSPYSGPDLLSLLGEYAKKKIKFAENRWGNGGNAWKEWCKGLHGIEGIIGEEERVLDPKFQRLRRHTDFQSFDVKQRVMTKFLENQRRLAGSLKAFRTQDPKTDTPSA
jgi:hypothetical protein